MMKKRKKGRKGSAANGENEHVEIGKQEVRLLG